MDGPFGIGVLDRQNRPLRRNAHQRALGSDSCSLHFRHRQNNARSRRPRHFRIPSQHTELHRRTQRYHRLPGLVLRQRRGRHRPYPVATNCILLRFVNKYMNLLSYTNFVNCEFE